ALQGVQDPETAAAIGGMFLSPGSGGLPQAEPTTTDSAEKPVKQRMADFGTQLDESEYFKKNWALTDAITKTWSDAANQLLPGPPSLAGPTKENIRELQKMAAGDGPKAAKARKLLEQYERMVTEGVIERPGWKTGLS
ncbi:MAG: hypothetical protein ACYSW8_29360, partial [Planctomycetota bacterium]